MDGFKIDEIRCFGCLCQFSIARATWIRNGAALRASCGSQLRSFWTCLERFSPVCGSSLALFPAQRAANWGPCLLPEIGRLGKLSDLRKLDLGDNQLLALPAAIGRLTGLMQLDLNNNQLTTLQAEIGWLIGLKQLNLTDTKLSLS